MAKMLKTVAAVIERIVKAADEAQTGYEKPQTGNDITYGDAVAAVMKGFSDSYWKNRALDHVPKNAEASEYRAAISICKDASLDDFWKNRALQKVFERP